MLNPQQLFNTIHEQVSQILPDASKAAQDDFSAQLKILVSGIIAKLDLVSREEFDAQQAVLERTRSKVEQLEKAISELEKKVGSQPAE